MTALELNRNNWTELESEPMPIVSGALALVVHAVFAAVLFLNMSWQHKVQPSASVKLWESLPVTPAKSTNPKKPAAKATPKPELPPEPQFDPVPQPATQPTPPQPVAAIDVPSPSVPQPAVTPVAAPLLTPPAADLAAPVRQKLDQPPPPRSTPVSVEPPRQAQPLQFEQQEVSKPEIDVDKLKRERALALAELLREEEQARLDQSIDRERDQRIDEYKKRLAERERKLEQGLEEIRAAQQARQIEDNERAEQEAASRSITDDFRARISAKIRQRVILPPDLTGNPEAIYEVSLLPGGDVTEVQLLRTSGFTAYDAAVERAILAAQPLPVPTESGLFQANFKKLLLSFRPKE